MQYLMTLLAMTQLGLEPPAVGQRYVALPGTPVFSNEQGQTIDRMKVFLHELTFVHRDEDGTSHFVLDGREPVKTQASKLFARDGLRPLLETSELSKLRGRYLGRRVWSYGTHDVSLEGLNPRRSANAELGPGKSVKIKQIFQIAKVPLSFTTGGGTQNDLDPSHHEWRELKDQGPYVFVYEYPNAVVSSWFGTADGKGVEDRRNYGDAYDVVIQDWVLEQTFSLVPPDKPALKAIHRGPILTTNSNNFLKGMTHLQAAWAYGWPKQHRPLSEILKEPEWTDHFSYQIVFKGDRVIESWWGLLP